jgi:hypothetical protein
MALSALAVWMKICMTRQALSLDGGDRYCSLKSVRTARVVKRQPFAQAHLDF